ncbi:MAG: TonB-dependent receptor [Saprospiraceae bacterium]|nr:TonB-dependent receptor [Saprospiraceae bacterium]
MYRLGISIICTCLQIIGFSQHQLDLRILDLEQKPFQNVSARIVQLNIELKTDDKGFCSFQNLPAGTYALAIDYLYDIEYRTLVIPAKDSILEIHLERRISYDEVLIKSYQLDVAEYPNAYKLNTKALGDFYLDKDIPYVLMGAPGVMVSSDAGHGIGYTGIRFRGLDPSHIQVTLNGIPFTDAESSLSYFVDIPDILNAAENISLIRGNVPGRPGTPSFGGALDIQTNQIKFTSGANLELQYGSFNTVKYRAHAHTGLIENKFHFELGLSAQNSDGYIDRSSSRLKSLFFSGGILKKKSAFRINYIHGSENTDQAWFGLPYQFSKVDSLRKYNAAGQEKTDSPYPNEIDDYLQDHIQMFYQLQFHREWIWSNTFNYTQGRGFYENYKAQVPLNQYAVHAFGTEYADLIRQKWLDNDFYFYKTDLLIKPSNMLEIRPEFSTSFYKGRHFGKVKDVIVDSFQLIRPNYYKNQGKKSDVSSGVKILLKPKSHWEFNFDIIYRYVTHEINGTREFATDVRQKIKHQYLSPKIFISHRPVKKFSFFYSFGYMQREPFREDILAGDASEAVEKLMDIEAGCHSRLHESLELSLNAYYMYYPSMRGLSGVLSDVGEPLFVNLEKVQNYGLEFSGTWKAGSGFALSHSSTYANSNIPEWRESYLKYSADWSESSLISSIHRNSRLAYQPAVSSWTEIRKKIDLIDSGSSALTFYCQHYYLSDFYLTNNSENSSKMMAYHLFNFGLKLEYKGFKHTQIEFWADVYNLLDENFFSHGWISRLGYEGELDLNSSPYLGKEGDQVYYYKGLYPQALRHFRCGLKLKF